MADAAEAKDASLSENFIAAVAKGSGVALVEEMIAQGADVNAAVKGVSPLMQAVLSNNSDVAAFLISKGADPNAPDTAGRTPLHAAVEKKYTSAIVALVKYGANPDLAGPDGKSPRMLAAANGWNDLLHAIDDGIHEGARERVTTAIVDHDLEALRRELDCGILKNFEKVPAQTATPLMLTIRDDFPEAMELLLKAGAKAETASWGGDTPLVYVLKHRMENPRLAALLLRHGAHPDTPDRMGDRPLLLAAGNGAEAIVRLLIGAKANVHVTDSSGENAVHKAAKGGHGEIIPLLKAAGAGMDAKDRQENTPLAAAIFEKRPGAVQALLASGADPLLKGKDGMTTLMDAAWAGDDAIVPELIRRGVDIKARREGDGFTALHFAGFRGKTAVAKALLDAGAPYEALTGDGRSVAQVARERGCADVADLIIEKMGGEVAEGLREPQTIGKPLRFIVPGAKNGQQP